MAYSVSSRQGFCFEWRIQYALSKIRLDSKEFVFDANRWQLTFEVDTHYLNVILGKINPEKVLREYTIRLFIEDKFSNLLSYSESFVGTSYFYALVIMRIPKSSLTFKLQSKYFIDGILKFVIVFLPYYTKEEEMIERVSDQFSQTSCSMNTVACWENLSHDLQQLMGDRTQSDLTLSCEERSFPAHKAILSARSPVFSAMFQSDMEESRTGIIEITDMDATVLHQFLLYIYSGKLSDLSVDTVSELYAAADKYAIESLKKLCAKFMKQNLARENACKFLIIADLYGDKEVKECAINFITNIELFLDEHVWLAFNDEHPKLASKVIHHAYKTKYLSKKQQSTSGEHC